MKKKDTQINKLFYSLAVALICCLISTTSCEVEKYDYTPIEYLKITGVSSTTANSTKDYYTFYLEDATYTWTVPAGATIKSGQGTSHISVQFGNTGGALSVEVNGMESEMTITILP
ncbi:MAG: hypothetical protein PHI28_14345 [Mangrovibacterium sp.]|nr:hypothetical protein [Mangrovibacterium sp.]